MAESEGAAAALPRTAAELRRGVADGEHYGAQLSVVHHGRRLDFCLLLLQLFFLLLLVRRATPWRAAVPWRSDFATAVVRAAVQGAMQAAGGPSRSSRRLAGIPAKARPLADDGEDDVAPFSYALHHRRRCGHDREGAEQVRDGGHELDALDGGKDDGLGVGSLGGSGLEQRPARTAHGVLQLIRHQGWQAPECFAIGDNTEPETMSSPLDELFYWHHGEYETEFQHNEVKQLADIPPFPQLRVEAACQPTAQEEKARGALFRENGGCYLREQQAAAARRLRTDTVVGVVELQTEVCGPMTAVVEEKESAPVDAVTCGGVAAIGTAAGDLFGAAAGPERSPGARGAAAGAVGPQAVSGSPQLAAKGKESARGAATREMVLASPREMLGLVTSGEMDDDGFKAWVVGEIAAWSGPSVGSGDADGNGAIDQEMKLAGEEVAEMIRLAVGEIEDPVAKHVPDFSAHGKAGVTIAHLRARFVHIACVSRQRLAHICRQPLARGWVPGRRCGYDSPAWTVLGGVVAEEELFAPLGLRSSSVGMSAQRLAELRGAELLAHIYVPAGGTRGVGIGMARPCPAGNGRGPARELAGLYASLLPGSERRVLQQATVERVTRAERVGMTDELQGVDTSWSLGFAVDCILSGRHAAPGAFGHGGSQSPDVHYRRVGAVSTAVYEDLGLAEQGARPAASRFQLVWGRSRSLEGGAPSLVARGPPPVKQQLAGDEPAPGGTGSDQLRYIGAEKKARGARKDGGLEAMMDGAARQYMEATASTEGSKDAARGEDAPSEPAIPVDPELAAAAAAAQQAMLATPKASTGIQMLPPGPQMGGSLPLKPGPQMGGAVAGPKTFTLPAYTAKSAAVAPPASKICEAFQMGGCIKGDACPDLHVDEDEAPPMPKLASMMVGPGKAKAMARLQAAGKAPSFAGPVALGKPAAYAAAGRTVAPPKAKALAARGKVVAAPPASASARGRAGAAGGDPPRGRRNRSGAHKVSRQLHCRPGSRRPAPGDSVAVPQARAEHRDHQDRREGTSAQLGQLHHRGGERRGAAPLAEHSQDSRPSRPVVAHGVPGRGDRPKEGHRDQRRPPRPLGDLRGPRPG
ncbi:unnamed protein product [Prorocentrum cordatum]|uniref:C3H1-type domain-containing protein n=1 Tax=Prorocentrum cordatum TaxID=2364126 RepID=A0ABN9PD74_9DINO|nr:unnamed protein product [Polarella glacialis]